MQALNTFNLHPCFRSAIFYAHILYFGVRMNLLCCVVLVALCAIGCREQTLPTIPPDPALERIFYSRASGTQMSIISVKSDGKTYTVLSSGNGYVSSTPYGYRITGVHTSASGGSIFTATTSARQQVVFSPGTEQPTTCALASDGTRIAYTTKEGNLYVSKLDGTNRVQLASQVFPYVQPAFSRDNIRVAFVSTGTPLCSLCVINIDSSGFSVLATNADTTMHSTLDWDPGSSSLLFVGLDANNNVQIYRVNALGANKQALTASPVLKSDPMWSPNGYKVAFSAQTVPNSYDVFICNPDGSDMQNVTSTTTDSERYPHWSPEGKRLIFTANDPPSASLRLLDTASRTTTTISGNVYGRAYWDYSGQ